MIRKVFSHTAIYGLAPQIGNVAQILILPIITKDLTSLDFGVAGVLSAYTSSISVLSLLGLRLVLMNSFYKMGSRYTWVWRQLYGFLILWNFFYASLLALLIYFVVPDVASENRWLIMFLNVAPIVFFGPTGNIGTLFYQLKQMPVQIGIRTSIFGILSALLSLLFISYFKLGYIGWFLATFIVGIISNLSYWYPLNMIYKLKPIFNFNTRRIRKSLVVSLPTIPHYYSSYLLNSSDKLVMDFQDVSTENIGKYQAAYTVGNIFQQLGYASGNAVTPMMMKLFKEKKEFEVRELIFFLQSTFLIGSFLFCIWLREFFAIIFQNAELAQMFPLGVVIIMSYNYRPMYLGAVNKIFFVEKTKRLWRITFLAGLLNIFANIWLIPIFGFEAAAYTTFVSLMVMGYSGFLLKEFRQNNFVKYYSVYWLVITVLLTFIAFYIVNFSITFKVVSTFIAVIVYFIFISRRKLNFNG